MSNILRKTFIIILIATLVLSFVMFIYGIFNYFGKEKVVNIILYNYPGGRSTLMRDSDIKLITDSINDNFNKQKDIFSLLITITSLGIFIISLITAINISDKSKEIEKYFSELKNAPEKLIRVFYDEIIKKIRKSVKSDKKDEALLENIRFITYSPTVYKEDFDLFVECYNHFQWNIGGYYTAGLTYTTKLMITVDQERAMEILKKDIIENKLNYEYMEAVIPIVGKFLDKEFVFSNLINTNFLPACVSQIFWNINLNDSDLIDMLSKTAEEYKQQNASVATYFAKKKKVIIDYLVKTKVNIPTNVFSRFFLHSKEDLELADQILMVKYIPEWVKEQMIKELKNNNIHIQKKWLRENVKSLKYEPLKKWLTY